MRVGRKTVGALAALGIAAPLAFGIGSMATAQDATQPPTRAIDLDDMDTGEKPTTPWLADDVIRTPDANVPVDPELDITTYGRVGPSAYVAIDDKTGDGMNNRLVRIDDDGVTEYAKGPVTRPFVLSGDRERIAWAEWNGETGRVVLADAASGEVVQEAKLDAETYTTGFVGDDSVVLRPAAGGVAKVWTPGDGIKNIPGAENATATDPKRGLASVVTGYEQDPDTGKTLACSSVIDVDAENKELWNSCDAAPVSFSPDGRYVWAKDTRADDAMPGKMSLLDARTGEQLVNFDLGVNTTQRVNWESNDSVVLDVWDDGRMALVRCSLANDGDCERATNPANHQEPVLNPPMPYLLPDQP